MPTTRRALLLHALACAALTLVACSSVQVHTKPGSGLTRDSSFALAVADDETDTRARLTSRLIAEGFNVIASLSSRADGDAAAGLPSRLRRVANALPSDAPTETGFASRYVLEVDHAYERTKRFGLQRLQYTRFSARMVDRVTGQVVLSAVLDGGRGIDDTLDELVKALSRDLGPARDA